MTEGSADEVVAKLLSNDQQVVAEISLLVERIVKRWDWPTNLDYQDVAQEIFSELISNLQAGKFRQEAKLTTYVYAMARHICIDKYRQAKAVEFTEIDLTSTEDMGLSAEDTLVSQEERQIACRVLLALPLDCRKLWRTIFWGKRNYAEAADVLGLSEGTVKRKMWECRKIAGELVKKLEK